MTIGPDAAGRVGAAMQKYRVLSSLPHTSVSHTGDTSRDKKRTDGTHGGTHEHALTPWFRGGSGSMLMDYCAFKCEESLAKILRTLAHVADRMSYSSR